MVLASSSRASSSMTGRQRSGLTDLRTAGLRTSGKAGFQTNKVTEARESFRRHQEGSWDLPLLWAECVGRGQDITSQKPTRCCPCLLHMCGRRSQSRTGRTRASFPPTLTAQLRATRAQNRPEWKKEADRFHSLAPKSDISSLGT